MLFSSYSFLLIYLPLMLGGFLLLQQRLKREWTVTFLLIGSLGFYAAWNWHHLPLLAGSILGNYLIGRILFSDPTRPKLILGVAFNLGILATFKYTDFILQSLPVSASPPNIALPLAISFYTFQQIAWLCDIYQKRTQPPQLTDYALFVSFFPQLIAGPIVHARELIPQITRIGNPDQPPLFAAGISFLALGLAKKVLIADTLSPAVDQLYNPDISGSLSQTEALVAASGYGLQLYFDFSGYADMAIGLALLFGIKLPENFNSPYKALSITDFWRRWHLTLSHFLRDYLYIGLGGNRKGRIRTTINLLLTMLLGGLWHGAGWQFALWGLAHGAMLSIHHAWRKQNLIRLPTWLALPLTFTCVSLAWIPFRAEHIQSTVEIFRQLATGATWHTENLIFGSTPTAALLQLDASGHLGWFLPPCLMIVWLLPKTASLVERLPLPIKGLTSGALIFLVLKTLSERPQIEFLYFNF